MLNSFYKIKNVKSRFLSGKKIYKTFLLTIFNSAFLIFNSFSQPAPGIKWQNTIGGNNHDVLYSIGQTADGGYILGGRSNSNISGDKTENSIGDDDCWIVKTDASGNIEWQNTIGGNDGDFLRSIRQTVDGGYILGVTSGSNISGDKTENSNGDDDYWIIKTDSSGNIQWQNTIGGSGKEALMPVLQTYDGGYILGGTSISNISGDKTEGSWNNSEDYWIVKINASGTIQWQNTIGGSDDDYLSSIQQTSDGGYILGGSSTSNISGDKTENSNGDRDYWIVKTDSLGTIEWQNTIGGSNFDEAFSIQQTVDGGYIVGGHSFSDISGDKTENSNGYDDYWIVKTDTAGVIQWENTIGGNNTDVLWSIQQTSDGGYIVGGFSNSNLSGDKTENSIGGYDCWVVKTDASGSIQWQNTIGGSLHDYLHTIKQTADDGYIFGGASFSNISGDKIENNQDTTLFTTDYWIIKLFPDTVTSTTQLPQLTNYPITISPNPLTTQSKLTFKNPNKEKFLFTLYDITGRCVRGDSPLERGQGCVLTTTSNEIILTKGSKQPGVYLFNLMNEKTGERWNGKIVIAD